MSKFRDPAIVVAELLKAHSVEPDKYALDAVLGDALAFDSLDLVEVELELEDEYDGIRFDDDIKIDATVQQTIDMVVAKLAAAKL